MILSANILSLLSAQYSHETANSLFYHALQSWAEMRGLDGTAAFMAKQASGELDHADKVLAYIHDRNEQLNLGPVTIPASSPAHFRDVFEMAQARERDTTSAILAIKAQAEIEGDAATCAWLMQTGGLVLEQAEEERVIQSIIDRLNARDGMVPLDSTETAMASSPGEVIHDIDTWLKANA